MSPFASYLRELRQRRGLKQKEVSELLGYEQSYLSSLEKGLKGLPRRAFIDRLVSRLALNAEEVAELERVVKISNRQVLLPTNAPRDEYELWADLRNLSGCLDASQLELIRSLLRAIAPGNITPISGCCTHGGTQERRPAM